MWEEYVPEKGRCFQQLNHTRSPRPVIAISVYGGGLVEGSARCRPLVAPCRPAWRRLVRGKRREEEERGQAEGDAVVQRQRRLLGA